MNWQTVIDPEVCGRVCLTLLHSLWQVALLAAAARAFELTWARRSTDKCYAVYVTALFLAFVAMPITYFSIGEGKPIQATATSQIAGATATIAQAAQVQQPLHAPANPQIVGTVEFIDASNSANVAPHAASPETRTVPWSQIAPWLAGVYAVGVVVMLLRLAVGILGAHRLAARAVVIEQGPLVDTLRVLAHNWSMRVVPVLARAESIVVPKVVGFVKPTILLPASAITGLSGEELEMVLAHELAHVKRYDMWVNLAQRLAEAVLFFNPALWYVSRRISSVREYCCDELTCGSIAPSHRNARAQYALALLRVVELSRRVPDPSNLATLAASGRSPSELRRRVARLFGEPMREQLRISRGAVIGTMILAILGVLAPIGWQSAAKSPADTDNPHQFELIVIDSSGKPIPRVLIELRADPAPTAEQVKRGVFKTGRRYSSELEADTAGHITIDLPDTPKYFIVKINQPGYGPYWAEWNTIDRAERIPKRFTAELDAAWSVGGVVVDEEGKPIQGATISPHVKYKKRPGDTQGLSGGKRFTTGVDGKWSFLSVPATSNDVFVEISHPEFMPERRSLARGEFEIHEGDKLINRTPLKRGITITGTISDETGLPIRDARVRTKFMNDIRETRTDVEGKYRLKGCEPSMARVVVSAQGKALDLKQVRVEPGMEPVDFVLKPGGHLRVVALDEQGKPIPKTRIFFQRWRGPIGYFEFDHINGYADENGVWEWNEAPLDEIQADICRPDGMQLSYQPLRARDEEYVFRPPPALVVSGTVIDADTKEPIKEFQVVPGIRSDDGPSLQWFRNEVYTATGGKYTVRQSHGYPAHLVRVEAKGYQAAVSRDIQSDEGNITIDFALRRGRNVDASVLTPDGKPAVGAKVALGVIGSQISVKNGDIDDGSTYHASRLDTDEAGRFAFPPQDANFQIVITHPTGYAYIKAIPDSAPSQIQLEAWANVEGVFRVGTEPAANVNLDLSSGAINSYGDDVPRIFTSYRATTGPGGKYRFDRVFPGDGVVGRNILFMVDDGATEVTSSKRVKTQFRAGETTQLDLGGDGVRVTGLLDPPKHHQGKVLWNFALVTAAVELPPLAPSPIAAAAQNDQKRRQQWFAEWRLTEAGKLWQGMADARERIRQSSPYFTATVDRDGTFHFDDMPPGNYTMSVRFDQHPAGQLRAYKFTIPAEAGGKVGESVDLGVLQLE